MVFSDFPISIDTFSQIPPLPPWYCEQGDDQNTCGWHDPSLLRLTSSLPWAYNVPYVFWGALCIANHTNLSLGSYHCLQQERQIGIPNLTLTKPIGKILASLGAPSVLEFEFLHSAPLIGKSVNPNEIFVWCQWDYIIKCMHTLVSLALTWIIWTPPLDLTTSSLQKKSVPRPKIAVLSVIWPAVAALLIT